MATVTVEAQGPPVLEWQHHDFYGQLPKGTHYVDMNGVLVPEEHPSATPITANSSGGDWWMDVKAVNNLDGTPGGYVAVGYSGAQNWAYNDGCYQSAINPATPAQDDLQKLETEVIRRGDLREAVAFYNLDGTRLWYKSFYGGVFEGVIQDTEGNIVICGGASNSNYQFFDDIADPKQLWLNPANSSTQTLLPTSGCVGPQGQMIVMKMDLSGNVIWNHLFNPSADANVAITRRTGGYDLVETNKNGIKGYRVVGNAYPLVAGNPNGSNRPYFVQIDLDGYKAWDHLIEQVDVYWPVIGTNPVYTNAIDRVYNAATQEEHFVLSGVSWQYPAPTSAWLMYFKEPATASAYVPFDWIVDTHVDEAQFPLVADPLAHQISTDVTFKVESGVEKIIFPVVANITGSWYAGGHYALNSPIYKLSSSAPHVVEAHTDLGELHAFDFRLGVTVTSDQNLVAVCTKWPDGFSVAGDHYGYDDLNANVQSCLTGYPLVNWSQTNPNQIPGCYYYWGSQSYATKLNGSDMSEIWHYQWNDPYNAADDCFPGNVRRRQCNFRVVEAADRGLVVCGNTGHNFDDAYLAKLKSHCEFQFDPSITYVCEEGVNDGSIALNVYGGSESYTYQWSNGATTADISGLAPGVYSVIVTEQGGAQCAETEIFTIAEPMVVAVTYAPSCMTGGYPTYTASVTDGGVGPFTFTWWAITSNDTHPPEVVYQGPVYEMHPGHWPPWDVEVFDEGTECTVWASEWGPFNTSWPPSGMVSSVVTPAICQEGITGAIDLTLDPAYAPYTFVWSSGATTEDLSGLEPGIYSVTVNFGQTCSLDYSYTVQELAACCPADLVIHDGTHSSSLPASISGSVDIRGQFIVDDDFQFAYAQIYMEPGAEIIVEPDVHFDMGYSTMESCSNTMWKSITANEGSVVYIRESTLSDAENVVTALNGANIVLIQDVFRDDRLGLSVPDMNGGNGTT
ncbi:MAG: SprB repeat-containing protein [Flavobacteriales bacterium]|nr:SprB repeat-containing protein [Flavobacteriales bacterium]